MILIDTSYWVEALRLRGNPRVIERMTTLVQNGQAAWCSAIRLELWAGIGDAHERKILSQFEQMIPELDINTEVWELACELASRSRKMGKAAPASDYIIAACARHHHVDLESADAHFTFLMKL
jgi:predicted nucleic acid-binding protein